MQIAVREWRGLDAIARNRLLARSEQDIDALDRTVAAIVDRVRTEGDAALRELTRRFDGADLSSTPLAVTPAEFEEATTILDADVREAIDYAIENVRRAHEWQLSSPFQLRETRPGVRTGDRLLPIESVGLYVPRGRGSFPSMLYMLAVPATLAGVPRVCVATPPGRDGTVDAGCLYAAGRCGVTAVYRVGGAQAIAALAYGTESIAPVAKIVGPGSAYVAAAKRRVRDVVDVGLPAGPSESMIVADASADAGSVSRDLLIEAEHGADSQALLVTTDAGLAVAVAHELAVLIGTTPEPRRTFLRSVFADYGGVLVAADLAEAAQIVNLVAPEHLQLRLENPDSFLEGVRNAGEVLVGRYTPFSLANYAAGANAVLPTGGAARVRSGVSVDDFRRRMSVVRVDREGFADIARRVITLADYEGFYWHAQALRDRLAEGDRPGE